MKHTEETKQKIRESNKAFGMRKWLICNKNVEGKTWKWNDESKRKFSELRKGKKQPWAKYNSKFKGKIPWNKNKKVPQVTGENNFNWKGGRHILKTGYVLIYVPDHPRANNGRYVFEHI